MHSFRAIVALTCLLLWSLTAQAAYNTGGNNSGGTPAGTNGQVQYNNNGAFGGLTTGQTMTTSGATLNITNPPCRPVVGTTDTLLVADYGSCVNYTTTSGNIATTFPNAATTGFITGYGATLNNRTNYTNTITPAAGQINGTGTFVMPPNTGCYFYSDSINWNVDLSQCTSLPIVAANLPTSLRNRSLGVSVDGGGAAIVSGKLGTPLTIPYSSTVIAYAISSDITGSAVVDVWKAANYTVPTSSANSITASALPTLTSSNYIYSTTLTGWTTTVSAGDVFVFNANSASSVTKLTIILYLQAN